MGMYDTITIDNKWISEDRRVEYSKQDYQTKSLECNLNKYDILEDGRLILNQTDKDAIMGSEILTQVHYNGKIRFYDDFNDYNAICENGIVKEVNLINKEYGT